MKIINEDINLIIPNKSKRIILSSEKYGEELIKDLSLYFSDKKRTNIIVYDENNEVMKRDDIRIVSIGNEISFDSNYGIKNKSYLNEFFEKIIESNGLMFTSIEQIRDKMIELPKNIGIRKLNEIMSKGLDSTISVYLKEFDINSILQMYKIGLSVEDYSHMYLSLLNLFIYENRYFTTYVYIDVILDTDILEKWATSLDNNVYIILNEKKVNRIPKMFDFLTLNNSDYIEMYDVDFECIRMINVLKKKIVWENIDLFDQEKIKNYVTFLQKNETFLLKYTDKNELNSIK